MDEHISTLHAAQKVFIAAELSDKLRHPLRKQTQNTHEFYEINDNFYYKRDSGIKWKGPAKVLGKMAQLFSMSWWFCCKSNL